MFFGSFDRALGNVGRLLDFSPIHHLSILRDMESIAFRGSLGLPGALNQFDSILDFADPFLNEDRFSKPINKALRTYRNMRRSPWGAYPYTTGGDSYGSGPSYSGRGRGATDGRIRPEEGLAPPVEVAGKVFPVEGYSGARLGLHHGASDGAVDIFAREGTPVRALLGGEVVSVGSGGLGGNTITIRQSDGKIAYYAHMQARAARQDGTPIRSGDLIVTGDMVGRVGQTGNAAGTGSHLHLGVGDTIQSGSGPEGGAGTNFNLTGTINGILAATRRV